MTLLSKPARGRPQLAEPWQARKRTGQESTSPVCRRPLNLSAALAPDELECQMWVGVRVCSPHQPGLAKKLGRARVMATAHWAVQERTDEYTDPGSGAAPCLCSLLRLSLGRVRGPLCRLGGRRADTARAHMAQDRRQPAREHHTSYEEDQALPLALTSQHRGSQGLGAPARRVQRGHKWVGKYVRHGVSASD